MCARSSCKTPDQYLEKQTSIKLLELWQLWLIKKEKKRKNSEYNSVFITTLKIANTIVLLSKHQKELRCNSVVFSTQKKEKRK